MKIACICCDYVSRCLTLFTWEELLEKVRATPYRVRSGSRGVDRPSWWLDRVDACFDCVYCERQVSERVALRVLLAPRAEAVVELVEEKHLGSRRSGQLRECRSK
jgi:hypothetical protein